MYRRIHPGVVEEDPAPAGGGPAAPAGGWRRRRFGEPSDGAEAKRDQLRNRLRVGVGELRLVQLVEVAYRGLEGRRVRFDSFHRHLDLIGLTAIAHVDG